MAQLLIQTVPPWIRRAIRSGRSTSVDQIDADQAALEVVGECDGFFLRVEGLHDQRRAKHFILHNPQ
jgi:hypothetical protein